MLLSRILGELLKQSLKNTMMLRGQISPNISEVFKEVASLNYKPLRHANESLTIGIGQAHNNCLSIQEKGFSIFCSPCISKS